MAEKIPTTPNATPVADMGTVEEAPYVGDSHLIKVACKHGDYDKIFKGATVRHGEKVLAQHYAAKHGTIEPTQPGS